jgi:tetratricopeptide (TPR) repeat protein
MGTSEKPSYANYRGMRKLGDCALSAGQYEKAIEYYEKALLAFNIPSHPKYLAVLEGIKKAKKEIAIKSGHFQPKSYVQDGIIRPLRIYIRLYSSKQLPDTNWEEIVLRVLAASLDNHPQLNETINLAGKNCETHSSWEYVPYSGEAFQNTAFNRGQTFFESLLASPNPRLCRLFSSDVVFPIYEQQTKGTIFVVVFGDEMA